MNEEELKALHWTQLKKLCEDNGLEYKGKDEAVAALLALNPPATDPINPPSDETPPDQPPSDDEQAEDPAETGPRLNMRRPYGEIYGEVEGAPNARYTQDGHLFDASGSKVG